MSWLARSDRARLDGSGSASTADAPPSRVGAIVGGRAKLRLADDPDRLGAEGYELQRLVLGDKAVEPPMRGGKAGGEPVDRRLRHRAIRQR